MKKLFFGHAALLLVVGCLLSGCATPQIAVAVVHPPTVAAALKIKRIGVIEFDGSHDAPAFTQDVENLLSSVRIQGNSYFQVAGTAETSTASGHAGSSYANPSAARSVGQSVRADAVFAGRITRSGATDQNYSESRSECAQTRQIYNKKGQVIGEDCVSLRHYNVSCVLRRAFFEFSPRLIEVSTGQSIFSDTLVGNYDDKACSDSGRGVADANSLIAGARQVVLNKIRTSIAPVEDTVGVKVMESGEFTQSESSKRFKSGLEFAKANRMDRACEIWRELEAVEHSSVAVLYSIGLCEEAFGNPANARNYYTRADKMSTEPNKLITEALLRTGQQVTSQQTLTKARGDVYRKQAISPP